MLDPGYGGEAELKVLRGSTDGALAGLPDDRRTTISAVRDAVNANLPEGYVETMTFGMIGWVTPLEDYPNTYNRQPSAIASLASQKNHIALYLMGLYSEGPELAWFEQQYVDRGMRLDMGRSCVRFKRLDEVPLDVVGEVIARIPPAVYLERYEAARRRTRRGR